MENTVKSNKETYSDHLDTIDIRLKGLEDSCNRMLRIIEDFWDEHGIPYESSRKRQIAPA
jgi:hypothetical protein